MEDTLNDVELDIDFANISGEKLTRVRTQPSQTVRDLKQVLSTYLDSGMIVDSLLKEDKVMMDEQTVTGAGIVNGDLLFVTIVPRSFLHVFNPCSPVELFQRWSIPTSLNFVIGSVKCCGIDCAPEVAKKIAQLMSEWYEDDHTIFVISNPGSDLREACAKALGLHGQVRLCTLAKTPYGVPDPKLGRLLQIVAQQLSEHFLFSIDGHEKPILFGGCACDGSVVGFCPSSYV